ncbi:hypothetical protein C2U72_20100 [Prosthecomicrobium hirschii]|nr:hypothetical protein C2U72_20100 [Prosthecomicrobium hirschii]
MALTGGSGEGSDGRSDEGLGARARQSKRLRAAAPVRADGPTPSASGQAAAVVASRGEALSLLIVGRAGAILFGAGGRPAPVVAFRCFLEFGLPKPAAPVLGPAYRLGFAGSVASARDWEPAGGA